MNKNLIVTVILAIVIIGAVILIARQFFGTKVTLPDDVKMMQEELIDQETGVLITKTVAEWDKLGKENGRYKNPDTGTFSMVIPHVCGMCGEKIPPVKIPAEYTGTMPDQVTRDRAYMEVEMLKAKYICPKCGKQAYAVTP